MTSPLHTERHLVIVLGATGDLMRRKLLPVLHELTEAGASYHLLAVARSKDLNDDSYRQQAVEALVEFGRLTDEQATTWAAANVSYGSIGTGTAADYRALRARIEQVERDRGLPGNRIFYLSLPPETFPKTISGLGEAGLNRSGSGWTRLVVEKPFGTDLATAQALNDLVHRHFDETQVYRIDHYLGKETVQNLVAFRFGNAIFESLWNRDRIQSVEITVAESLGVEKRAGYYDQAGALRDMMQNHLTQLLTLTAMEVPARFDARAIRHEKEKVLRSIVPYSPDDVVFGQYGAGEIDSQPVPAYREEQGVAPNSHTETFVAMHLRINNWRWQGVPFFLRTGKRLPQRQSKIVVTFRRAPVAMFGFNDEAVMSNRLVIRLQPEEGFELDFGAKAPGDRFVLKRQRLQFAYKDAYGELPDAYQTLLYDVMQGDQTLFVHADEVESSWRLYAPLLEEPPPLLPYAAGTWGPEAAQALLRR
ncbi:MAG: glucose-6-phosphate dehydrogenase [Planctomycetota bacterium]